MLDSSHFWDFFLFTSGIVPPDCWAEAVTEEAVELLFFSIPLMGLCEVVEVAMPPWGDKGRRGRAEAAARSVLGTGRNVLRASPGPNVTKDTADDITEVATAVMAAVMAPVTASQPMLAGINNGASGYEATTLKSRTPQRPFNVMPPDGFQSHGPNLSCRPGLDPRFSPSPGSSQGLLLLLGTGTPASSLLITLEIANHDCNNVSCTRVRHGDDLIAGPREVKDDGSRRPSLVSQMDLVGEGAAPAALDEGQPRDLHGASPVPWDRGHREIRVRVQALSAPGPSGGTGIPATGSSGESWPYTPSSLSSHTVRFTPVCGTRQDTLRYAVHTASAPREPGAWGLSASRKHHASNREKPQPPRHKTPAPGGGPMARALCGSRGPLARTLPALGRTPAGPRCAPGGEGPAARRARVTQTKGPPKTVGVEPGAEGKGVVVVIKPRSHQQKPTSTYLRTTINKNAQATLSSIRHTIYKNKYLPDLCMAATRTTRAILHSQKPVMRRVPLHPYFHCSLCFPEDPTDMLINSM
ncbi:hypothetical protein GH733_019114 [Mirounga leonina]|nr:hypothetical protein GH733_019114 [Mirounga leonina]